MTLPPKWPAIVKERLEAKGHRISLSTIYKTKKRDRKNFFVLQELKALEIEFKELTNP
jgi:hypothetical protein